MAEANKTIRVGGAAGFWGEASLATKQLLDGGDLDYLVYDYLAEITMAILSRMKAKDPTQGFATDFVSAAMGPNLSQIAEQKVKVISNAGGVNPKACAEALRATIADQGLNLKVATVEGDDILPLLAGMDVSSFKEMFTGADFPELSKVASANAYLGAFPIAEALKQGADIVVTGRCVDSAVTLAACIDAFGWKTKDFDHLASGSLAGHLLECGPQATGGNFTDWQQVPSGFENIGYPIAEIERNGDFVITKPGKTAGLVSVGTISEQMLYEIGDPQAYELPDVSCDFSAVKISQQGPDRVAVTGTKGWTPSNQYKVCLTHHQGFRIGHLFGYYGMEAEAAAEAFARASVERAERALREAGLAGFRETSVEILGAESQYGNERRCLAAREVTLKLAAIHDSPKGAAMLIKEATGLALSAPPGLCGFAGARPKPSPILALFSFLLPKDRVSVKIADEAGEKEWLAPKFEQEQKAIDQPAEPSLPLNDDLIQVPLVNLAWARSGDKGNKANIGVIARKAEYLPFIWQALSTERVQELFSHFSEGAVHRFLLPGPKAINFVLDQALGGGGVSSLRNDPQGKGYSQLLLEALIPIPKDLMEESR